MASYHLHGFNDAQQSSFPDEAEWAELVRLRERFHNSHRIFCDITPERGVRYLAHGATDRARPHTVITSDLRELGDELEQSARSRLRLGASHVSALCLGACSRGTGLDAERTLPPVDTLVMADLTAWLGGIALRLLELIGVEYAYLSFSVSPLDGVYYSPLLQELNPDGAYVAKGIADIECFLALR
jgi:hypothetical protein